eukprot:916835_1
MTKAILIGSPATMTCTSHSDLHRPLLGFYCLHIETQSFLKFKTLISSPSLISSMAAQTSNINVNPKIFEREYLHILTRMNPCGQSDIIDRYVEEATNYETNTPLKEARDKSFQPIEHKFIQILDGVLNNGEVPLDVAFCRLIIILPYAQRCSNYSAQFIGSFVYFILGSCFPSLRQKIDLNPQSKVVRYLIETYFPNLNDTRCIKFKYAGHKSTRAILSALQEYMITSVASI